MSPPLVAFAGVVLGLATLGYLHMVLIPALSSPNQTEAFPPCLASNTYYQYTTKGEFEKVDRFLCMVLPFFVKGTGGSLGAWNWAELLLTFVPIGIHGLEASTTSKRAFWVLLVPFVVAALGQVIGISVAMPLLGLPFYALSAASQAAKRETSLVMTWMIILTSLVFVAPLLCFFVFPHNSKAWLYTVTIFQFSPPLMFLAPLPFALCCKNPGGDRARTSAHTYLLGLYGLAAGACVALHLLASLNLAQACDWRLATLQMLATKAWEDLFVRFLLVDHGVSILAILLMVLLDGGVSSVLFVVLASPFLSVGGAVSLFYARPHQLWLVQRTNDALTDDERKDD